MPISYTWSGLDTIHGGTVPQRLINIKNEKCHMYEMRIQKRKRLCCSVPLLLNNLCVHCILMKIYYSKFKCDLFAHFIILLNYLDPIILDPIILDPIILDPIILFHSSIYTNIYLLIYSGLTL